MTSGIIQEHSHIFMSILKIVDIIIFVVSALLTYHLRFDTWIIPMNYQIAILVTILLILTIFNSMHIYQPWRGRSVLAEIRLLFFALGIIYVLLTTIAHLSKTSEMFSRQWSITMFAITFLLMSLFRSLCRLVLRKMRSHNRNIRTMYIVGAGKLGKKISQIINSSPWMGLKIRGFFDDKLPQGTKLNDITVLGDLASIKQTILQAPVNQLWFALPLKAEDKIVSILNDLRFSTIDIIFVPDVFGFNLLNHSVTEIAGIPVVNISSSPITGIHHFSKRLFDLVLGSIFIVLAAPVMLITALLVKITSPGPVLFKQKRHGFDGREIKVYKFRSMYLNSDSGPYQQARKNDNRITPFGRFIRRTSLDELPQLFNVLQGRMSLVGPRPHPLALNEEYKDKINMYMQRHKVLPGITGWAQINGFRGEFTEADSAKGRIECDIYYINNWSIWLDLKIIILTFFKGFTGKTVY